MRFQTQQAITLSLAAALFIAMATGAAETHYPSFNPEDGESGGLNLLNIGIGLIWIAAGRWLFRYVWFSQREATWMKNLGWTSQSIFNDAWYTYFNRWLFHVDRNGENLDDRS